MVYVKGFRDYWYLLPIADLNLFLYCMEYVKSLPNWYLELAVDTLMLSYEEYKLNGNIK